MAHPRIVPFKPEHLDLIEGIDRDTEWARHNSGIAFTGFIEDRAIGAAGVLLLWPGVGHAWTALSPEARQHGLWLTRIIRQWLRRIIALQNLHRVEAIVLAEAHEHRRWIESFGFEAEGIAHEYTTDRRDAIRYELLVFKPVIKVEEVDGEVFCRAYAGEVCVGYVSHRYHPDEPIAYGTGVIVAKPWRGRGLAKQLHDMRLLTATLHGSKWFVGQTSDHNEAMKRVLERSGGTRVENSLGITWVTPLELTHVR